MQEPILFNKDIKTNILFGKPDATDEEVYLAAQKANALEFIESDLSDLTLDQKQEYRLCWCSKHFARYAQAQGYRGVLVKHRNFRYRYSSGHQFKHIQYENTSIKYVRAETGGWSCRH